MSRPSETDSQAADLTGRSVQELSTPALLLHESELTANIERMAAKMRDLPAEIRPHAKVHKCREIARRQIEAGAVGVTVATVWEAEWMVDGGIENVLVANQLVGARKLALLSQLAQRATIRVAVDDEQNIEEIARAAQRAGTEVGLLVEIDIGMGRAGARTTADAARLASVIVDRAGVRFDGLMGYEGHCTIEPDNRQREIKVKEAIGRLLDAAAELNELGLVCSVVSAGGTATYAFTGACPGVTEVQAGSYAVMDVFHEGLTTGFAPAVTVLATVISRHDNLAVLDAGRKAVGVNRAQPRLLGSQTHARFVNEEHSGFDAPDLRVGDIVEIVPGYTADSVNGFDGYVLVSAGFVTGTWKIGARYGLDTVIRPR